MKIIIKNILNDIFEISNINLQRKLWLNENNDTKKISSYVELMCRLFDDNNFEEFTEIEIYKLGYSKRLCIELNKLKELLNSYQEQKTDEEIIIDPKWLEIVNQAKLVLALLPNDVMRAFQQNSKK